ncbi:MAG: aspartate/glutamate racemase family protein [Candidatus Bathyarchaeia archaeon]
MVSVAAIYTGQGLMEIIQKIFYEEIPYCTLINILDDSIIQEVIKNNGVTPRVAKRLIYYFCLAEEAGADIILNTCSSVGEIVDVARRIVSKPVIRIDEPMAEKAVENFNNIGVLATLPTALKPTINLLKRKALERNKNISIVEGLADGAYQALISGDLEKHDELIMRKALNISNIVEVLVLAQGSMSRIEDKLAKETNKPILSSPRLAIRAIKSFIRT